MSSLNFAISPQSGEGRGYIAIMPLSTNDSYADRKATVTITNGVVTKTVPVVHWGIPNFTIVSGSTTVSYTGGEVYYRMTSHYRFRFTDKPSWITISSGTTTYYQDTWYTPASDDFQILFTVAPATSGNEQIATNFKITFDALSGRSYDLPFILQGIPQEDYFEIVPDTYYIDWDDINTHRAFTVSASDGVEWTATPDNLVDFDWIKLGAYYNCTAMNENTSTGRYYASVDFNASGFETRTRTVIQYQKPRMTTSATATVPSGGGAKGISVNSNNGWYISGIPSYVTATYQGAGVDLSQRQNGSAAVREYVLTWPANTATEGRTATITLHYYDLSGTEHTTTDVLSFTQEAVVIPVPTISVSPTSVGNTATEVILTVTSGYEWWISTLQAPFNGEIYDYDTGDRIYPQAVQGAVTNKTYRIGISANNTYSTRQARIQFVWRETDGVTTHSIYSDYVTQAAKTLYTFTLEPSGNDYTWEMQGDTFTVTPDDLTTPWVATAGSNWISIIDDVQQTGVATISFDVDDNTSGESRNGEISINYLNGDAVQAVAFSITQYAEGEEPIEPVSSIVLSDYLITLNGAASSYAEVQVDSATDWYAEVSDSWIQIDINSGVAGVETITVSVSANTGSAVRAGRVDFYDDEDSIQASLTVYQNPQS